LKILNGEGLIKRLPQDKKKVEDAIALAHRDLRTSCTILNTIATGHTPSRITLFSRPAGHVCFAKGYRLDGANQHISVVKFAELF
jgi:hypothetical protein